MSEADELLRQILESGDIVGRDAAGLTVIQLAIDRRVLDRLMVFGANAVEAEDGGDDEPYRAPKLGPSPDLRSGTRGWAFGAPARSRRDAGHSRGDVGLPPAQRDGPDRRRRTYHRGPPQSRAGDVGREQERKVGKVQLSAAPMGVA
jgi:hypothetical protein